MPVNFEHAPLLWLHKEQLTQKKPDQNRRKTKPSYTQSHIAGFNDRADKNKKNSYAYIKKSTTCALIHKKQLYTKGFLIRLVLTRKEFSDCGCAWICLCRCLFSISLIQTFIIFFAFHIRIQFARERGLIMRSQLHFSYFYVHQTCIDHFNQLGEQMRISVNTKEYNTPIWT